MPRKTAIACFRSPITSETIDAENGIVRGVKVMELNRVATFAAPDGKTPLSTKITAKHIDALLSHAGNRSIPVHKTHSWHGKGDGAEMDSRIGCLKAIRKDDAGNLVADLHLMDGGERSRILWSAEHNPEDTMLSAVFEYRKDDKSFIPLSFDAADIVPRGAGVTALFADASTQSNSMDINELLAALKDPAVLDALKAVIKSVESNQADASDETAAAEMESAAGVTDADKKPDDDSKPALMRAMLRCSRAQVRKGTETAQLSDAQKLEIATVAKAAVVGEIGKGEFLSQITGAIKGGDKQPAFVARLGKFIEGGASQGRAIAMARQVAPSSEVAEWEAAQRPMPKKAA